ncbi:hypothetical protein KQX54_002381 [Cotesia glomerata]|uniref:Uncharacterized protein n=1 Tax=Cotesia glomerata TaxID=32391 RepID=A0AAV7HZZ3_COTGL|nr:hypothetical protein KQX54_002381 [Cotesia glomerata]
MKYLIQSPRSQEKNRSLRKPIKYIIQSPSSQHGLKNFLELHCDPRSRRRRTKPRRTNQRIQQRNTSAESTASNKENQRRETTAQVRGESRVDEAEVLEWRQRLSLGPTTVDLNPRTKAVNDGVQRETHSESTQEDQTCRVSSGVNSSGDRHF